MIKIIKGIFYYSGAEYIYRKIKPAKEPRPLPTLPLWLIVIYIVSFGVASLRYENRIDIIENKANTINLQLASPDPVTKGMALRRILKIQEMESPYKPDIKNVITIVHSFWKNTRYEGVADLMRETIENWKGSLNSVDLSRFDLNGHDLNEANLREANLKGTILQGANLKKANLKGANLEGTILKGANLKKANLKGANLQVANLEGANLEGANLEGAILKGAILQGADLAYANLNNADLWGANLEGANLAGANLEDADLRDAKGLTIGRLSNVKTLYRAQLDPELMQQVKEKCPNLLEQPEIEEKVFE